MSSEGSFGSCGCGLQPIVARAGLHYWEEPCISGARGSGAVFFSGCSLHCVFCQNYQISREGFGKEVTLARLKEIYAELIAQGAHNINLVTPTHFAETIRLSLGERLPVPVIYNTSGFETLDTLRKFKGKIQVYLPDFKYADYRAAIKFSNAPDYFRVASAAIRKCIDKQAIMNLTATALHKKAL
jgi:putative pyruvate formate lyase activating enzyme